jgi:hypothetical protein
VKKEQEIKFDVVFLSYDEPLAEEHWKRLKKRFPYAQRVHGVKGILKAHKECAKLARTGYFFVVDGDAYILDSFNFDEAPSELSEDFFYMWSSRNAINDLTYSNGGVKLLSKAILDDVEDYGLDMFITLPHKNLPEVASLSRFNATPFYSWRAGFRECAQLACNACKHSKEIKKQLRIYLLNVWCNKGINRRFGIWCIKGARAGRRYGMENKNNEKGIEQINDFDWLRKRFYYELKEGYLKGMESELDGKSMP